jgi:hypothetical protein
MPGVVAARAGRLRGSVAPMSEPDWTQVARGAAREAHEQNFSSRRGVYALSDAPDTVVVYDNNPIPERDGEHAALLTATQARVLAQASWPEGGPSAGYTAAWVLRGPDALARVRRAWGQAVAGGAGSRGAGEA